MSPPYNINFTSFTKGKSMATRNATSSTNNVNIVLYNHSRSMEYMSDRKTTIAVARGRIKLLQNLSNVQTTNPFTVLTS